MFCFIEPERIIIDCVLHLNIWNGCIQILGSCFQKVKNQFITQESSYKRSRFAYE